MKTKSLLVRITLIALFFSMGVLPCFADQADDWIPLFDGKTLTGWETLDGKTPSYWKAEDNALHFVSPDNKIGSGNLYTAKQFANFILELEWKIAPGGNSGIKYRMEWYGKSYLGPEYQVYDDTRFKNPGENQRKHMTGCLYDIIPVDLENRIMHPPGKWNKARIVANGNLLEHRLNGKLVMKVDVTSERFKKGHAQSKFKTLKTFAQNHPGRILLQDHNSEVWYRNIRIKVLPDPNASKLVPADLRCEYLDNPEGIADLHPRLSWKVEIAPLYGTSLRGQKQTAYRILAAGSEKQLADNRGDLWDTGKVETNKTLHIEYKGKPPGSYDQVFWKVRIWDQDGKASPWSDVAHWSMGPLASDDWKGKWLGYSEGYTEEHERELQKQWDQKSPSPVFRREFTINKPVRSAYVYVCGLGYHTVEINGKKVGDHVLDPAFTRYDRSCLYVTHPVTDLVKKGGNAIGVMLGNGWYNVHTQAAWNFNKAAWRAQPKLLLQLRITFEDGSTRTVVTDKSWKAATGPVRFDGIRKGEFYDARREMSGWSKPGFDDGSWKTPSIVEAPKGSLRPQVCHPIKVTETITPKKITEPVPGIHVFDLGQNIAGWARLHVKGKKGTVITLRYGERLKPNGTLEQKQISVHTKGGIFQTDTYILKGKGVEVWEPRFVYHGFQYVEVTGLPQKPTKETLAGRVVHTAFEQTGSFSCSNELLNKIQRCTLWSYRGNFHGHPTDCPHREKNGWTGDAHLAAVQAMFNFQNGASYTKWIMDLAEEQKPTGELPGIVPTAGWGYHWGNGPAWDSAFLLIPWYMYTYYGDERILKENYGQFKRYVDYLATKAKDHIVSIGLGDWVPAKTKTPASVTSTGYYYVDTKIVARVAGMLGKTEEQKHYQERAEKIKQAFNKTFYKGNGIYANGSQTALSCALFQGLVPGSERKKVAEQLLKAVAAADGHIDTGILGAKYIFNSLTETGHHETAYQMAIKRTFPSYGYWIDKGATTLWEDWKGGASLNHIMFGDISAWFYKNISGIHAFSLRFLSGFSGIIFMPRPVGDLTWVKARYESVRGTIASEWKIENGTFTWTIEVPPNTRASVFVPGKDPRTIRVDGKKPDSVAGVECPGIDGGLMPECLKHYMVNSGTYTFTCKW